MSFIKFVQQFKHSTTGLMAMGILGTLLICGGYRVIIKPKMDKQQREEAESFAEYIFQKERQKSLPPSKDNF